jgi:hypothetical protein
MAVLEFVCGGMFGQVYSGLSGIAVQCGIEDGLKVAGIRSWQGHQSRCGRETLRVGGMLE